MNGGTLLRAARGPIVVRTLGRRPYEPTREAMVAFTHGRDAARDDEIWLVEHEPVYTLGQAGRDEHLHGPVDIPVVRTERGGQITYHGPGQVVLYPLIDLRRRDIKVREFVRLLEDAVVEVLAAYNLRSATRPGAPGVYVDIDGAWQKVAALGLKIVNGRSFHGLSLNVAVDLSRYAPIDACGYPGLVTTDLRTLGVVAEADAVAARLAAVLIRRIDDATPRDAAVRPPDDRRGPADTKER